MNTPKKLYYPAIFHPEKTGYSVTVPDLEGCFSEGDTLEQAIEQTADAIGLYLEDQQEFPTPTNPATLHPDPGDFVSLVLFDALAYRRKYDQTSVKKTLSLPSWLNAAAEAEHINFSSVLQAALKERLHLE